MAPQRFEHALSEPPHPRLDPCRGGSPRCTRMLAEMGADVIKVEGAPGGRLGPLRLPLQFVNQRSLYFVQQNRGKRSLCVDPPPSPGASPSSPRWCPTSTSWWRIFARARWRGLGLGYERLCELKSDIILCSISAGRPERSLAHIPGYDFIAQAYSGITSMTGPRDDAPYMPAAAIGDISTGVHGALAIVAALPPPRPHRAGRTPRRRPARRLLPLPRCQRGELLGQRRPARTDAVRAPRGALGTLRHLSRLRRLGRDHGLSPSLAGSLQSHGPPGVDRRSRLE